ncbi:hypothetical protein [Natrinema marinum]|uniref:hypothetical protein n=1 Tax=Natrinema marinum TaxID=2961598 RepID=UPI0020C8A947|nr:hypothetical protein [Natrinema marinum]
MSTPHSGVRLDTRHGLGIAGLVLASIVVGFLSRELLLYSVLPIFLLGSAFICYLFYRLVLAVEHLAYEVE